MYQERTGYRFSLDAVLLAGLSRVRPHDRVVDLGTGCGVVLLILAHRGLGQELVGMEIQPELAELARTNVAANGFSDQIEVREADFRRVAEHLPPESFDVVVSNPPYRRLESGRINPHPQRAYARHELKGSVADVFGAAKYLLPQGGAIATIYPASRLDHLLVTALRYGFCPKNLTIIYSEPRGPARLVHLESRKGGGDELRILPPFYVHQEDGAFSQAMKKMYEE